MELKKDGKNSLRRSPQSEQTIYDHAVRTNTDLIIVSSKGKGGFAAFMVGSVAMQLVQADLHIPLWVVRRSEK
jgi:nucleotide-binding universal stress UspA family protein